MIKTIILGFDAFDPRILEKLHERNRVPNLSKWIHTGGYARFGVANPPQSEVSWTSIATGQNPGEHAIFDFVHRNPKTYQTYVSLLPTQKGLGGTQFVSPHNCNTLFDQATRLGYPAKSFWWPATFPARYESPVQTIPGLGTPDLRGRLGVGTILTTAQGLHQEDLKTEIQALKPQNRRIFSGSLLGPVKKSRSGTQETAITVKLTLEKDRTARLQLDKRAIDLKLGEWSPILELRIKVNPIYAIKAVTRVILTSVDPEVSLYFLPLQIHPLHSPWRYGTSPGFVKDTWKNCGPFLTLGWPQDTTALEEGWINDEQFLLLCSTIFQERERTLSYHLNKFQEGVLAAVFDSLDRVQHMFWGDRQDIIESWYVQLDGLVGRIQEDMSEKALRDSRILVVSDHGFCGFNYKVHLNRWLIDHGYLKTTCNESNGNLSSVIWSQSQAYAIGLNSLYLNLDGREGEGIVTDDQKSKLSDEIGAALLAWKGPDGSPVIRRVYKNEEAFRGSNNSYGPDLVIGYTPGYRASAETGLGGWKAESLEYNRDHWGGDHCIDPESVPGVIFCNQGLENYPAPSYEDFPYLAIGTVLDRGDSRPPPTQSEDEDEKLLEERLKGLGYL